MTLNKDFKRTIADSEAKIRNLKLEIEDLEETVEDIEIRIINKDSELVTAYADCESLDLRYTHLMDAYDKLQQQMQTRLEKDDETNT